MDHRASAEHLLDLAATERDAAWAQVFATRALAHATLAGGLPQPSFQITPRGEHHVSPPQQVWPTVTPQVWCSTDRDEMDPIVIWRGKGLVD